MEVVSTKSLLGGRSAEELMNGKRMTDKRLRWALKYLNLLYTPLYMLHPHAIYMSACRIVKLSLEHGFCSDSASALRIYGWGVLTFQNDVEENVKWCRAALCIVKSFGGKQTIPRVTMNVNIISY
jgi:predicted ATPase